MGGKALSTGSSRLLKPRYEEVASATLEKLARRFSGLRASLVGNLAEKQSFGDCDILIEDDPEVSPRAVVEALGGVTFALEDNLVKLEKNPVTSVGILLDEAGPIVAGNIFQIDVIRVAPESFDFALNYYGQGDAGNLMGPLARSAGVKLRHDGLVYQVRVETSPGHEAVIGEVPLTRQFDQMLSFLGLDPVRYRAGFDNLTQAFEFVSQSPLFDLDKYLPENLNSRGRRRDSKRGAYSEFIQWCNERALSGGQRARCEGAQGEGGSQPGVGGQSEELIWETFPEQRQARDQMLSAYHVERAALNKLDTQWASEVTRLTGPALGRLMADFRFSFPDKEARIQFLRECSQDELAQRLLALRDGQESARWRDR